MSTPQPITIEAGSGFHHYWRDLWRYRELFYMMAWRDVLLRYKRMTIGFAWAVLRPFLTMLIFTLVFGKLAKLPDGGVPYVLLVCAGMLPWQFFANAFSEASNSLVANSSMLSKVYFPRLIIPASSVIVALIDFCISLGILIVLMIWYRFVPGPQIIFMPLFLLLAIIVTLGAGFWIAALNVKYRDFRYVVPFIVQFGLYISPVGFTSSVIPEKLRLIYSLNPMVGVIDGFRWSIFGGNCPIDFTGFTISVVLSVLLFIYGLYFFRKMERSFADII